METNIRVKFTEVSRNSKIGPIPVTTTERSSCPPSCSFYSAGCYAEHGPISWQWKKMSNALDWGDFCDTIAALPKGSLWRHNQAGDLPGQGEALDTGLLAALVKANRGRRGFTYTHKAPAPAMKEATDAGFTINLSADSMKEADQKASLELGPVVVIVAEDSPNSGVTPEGRKWLVCPEQTGAVKNCQICQACAVGKRKTIIAFRAHGVRKNMVNKRINSRCSN